MRDDFEAIHVPVQVDAVVAHLAPREDETILDGTIGMGGHALQVLAATTTGRIIGLDRDDRALTIATSRLSRFAPRFTLVRSSFENFADSIGATMLGGALLDLGISSLQIDDAARGFSYSEDGPLDMRMDPRPGVRPASDLVNRASPADLVRWIRDLGDEPAAKRIVDVLVAVRERAPLRRTCELRDVVARGLRTRSEEVLTRTLARVFMALRIVVNDEIGALERTLPRLIERLLPDRRLVVLSFHGGEDRVVKNCFQDAEAHGLVRVLTPRPLEPSAAEVARNPRARSSKLRALERLGRTD